MKATTNVGYIVRYFSVVKATTNVGSSVCQSPKPPNSFKSIISNYHYLHHHKQHHTHHYTHHPNNTIHSIKHPHSITCNTCNIPKNITHNITQHHTEHHQMISHTHTLLSTQPCSWATFKLFSLFFISLFMHYFRSINQHKMLVNHHIKST